MGEQSGIVIFLKSFAFDPNFSMLSTSKKAYGMQNLKGGEKAQVNLTGAASANCY